VAAGYVPDRRDVIWLDFEPRRGREIGKYRPALVLSSVGYNRKTGLLICCPISSSIRGSMTEVPVAGLEKPSVIAASLVQTLSWTDRKARKIRKASRREFTATLQRLLPLIGAEEILSSGVSDHARPES
jgi:mRNA interferase MazF